MDNTTTLEAARAALHAPAIQARSLEVRRAMLAGLQPGTPVQVADGMRLRAPTVLALVEAGPTYCLEDARLSGGVWVGLSARFNADGCEVDATGAVLPGGRVLVVPRLTAQEAAGVLAEWTERVESFCAATTAEAARARPLPQPPEEVEVIAPPPTDWLDVDVSAAMEAYASAMAAHRSEALGLTPTATFTHAKAVLSNLHETARDLAATLAMLSPAELEAVASAARLMQRACGARGAHFTAPPGTAHRAATLSRGYGNTRPLSQ